MLIAILSDSKGWTSASLARGIARLDSYIQQAFIAAESRENEKETAPVTAPGSCQVSVSMGERLNGTDLSVPRRLLAPASSFNERCFRGIS